MLGLPAKVASDANIDALVAEMAGPAFTASSTARRWEVNRDDFTGDVSYRYPDTEA
jgi:hypothetical protein